MKHEIINLQDVQVIGMSKEIPFNHSEECTKFWGDYVERIVKPVYMEGKTPDEFQQAAIDNNVGEFGLPISSTSVSNTCRTLMNILAFSRSASNSPIRCACSNLS